MPHPGTGIRVVALACVAMWGASAAQAAPASQPARGWIWSQPGALQDAPVETRYFRYEFDVKKLPERADVLIGADNSFQLYVNGVEGAASGDWQKPVRQDIRAALRVGRNAVAVVVGNGGGPAWFYVEGTIGGANVGTGAHWRWAEKPDNDSWLRPNFGDHGFASHWKPAALLGDGTLAPHVREKFNTAETVPAIPPPTDWNAFRERQRQDLAAATRPADPPAGAAGNPVDRFVEETSKSQNVEKSKPEETSKSRKVEKSKAEVAGSAVRTEGQQDGAKSRKVEKTSPEIVDDATFARRAYLDVTGLPPTEKQLTAFTGDTAPDKRAALVRRLLSDDLAYAQGWMAWWCDLLRNDEQTNIDNLRKPVTRWLFGALKANKPYDQMVAELLNPGPSGPDGYLKGINWRGIVNASQRPPVQAAQNVGQVFLATSIKCASCHDHFTRPILLEDSYGLASFFSATNLEIYRCDKPTGAIAKPEFLIHNTTLARISPDADLPTRLRAISEMVTSVRDPNFAPAIVNRIWKKLMGRGLFEPVDDITSPCANRPLLDWLAYDFMSHDYDLKHTIELLMTSRAYQLAAITETTDEMRRADKTAPAYAGPPLRRLSSEQFLDAVSQLTGYWPKVATMDVTIDDPHIRAWRHRIPDPLAMSLGRPNREQVCTVRVEDASMIQALELTNGKVLSERLVEGSRLLLGELGSQPPAQALTTLYLRGLGRPPRSEEASLLVPLLGEATAAAETRRPGWEDVLWIIVMSPEFQYIQ